MRENYKLHVLEKRTKKKILFVLILTSFLLTNHVFSQTITYAFANAQITNDGMDSFYEADIVLTTDTDFALGAGQFYLDYNTAAFGTSIEGGNLTFAHPVGSTTSYVLDEQIFGGALDGYNIVNANSTTSKLSISWSTAVANQVSTNITIAGSPNLICHIKIKYVDVNEDPNISFDITTSPDAVTSYDLTFTDGGTQLTNDSYDSSDSAPCIMWDGSTNSDWDTASNWGSNSVPTGTTDVVIPANQTVVASGNVSVNDLTLESGAALTVTTNATHNGTIMVKSGASIIAQNSTTFNLTYNRNLTTNNWYLVSSGVVNETIENLISTNSFASGSGSNIGISDYDNTTPGWTYSTLLSTGTLASGEGRSIKLLNAGDFSFSGDMPLTDVSITIADGAGNGFNLIGNPFPSYLPANHTSPSAFNNILRANTGILNEETIWFWDQSTSSYKAINQASALADGIRYIAPGQGFFVESNGAGGSFTFAESMQSHQSTDVFSRNMNSVPKIKLKMTSGNADKTTDILYLQGMTTGWNNGYDATIFNGGDTSFAIYTHLVNDGQGENLGIQALPNSNYESMVIPIGVNASSGTTLTISAVVTNLPAGINAYLEDRDTDTFILLDQINDEYSFTLSNDTSGIGRFYLHTSSSVLSIGDEALNTNISVYLTEPTNLRIAGITDESTRLHLYNLQGKEILSEQFIGASVNDVPLPNLPSGVYIVNIQNRAGMLSKKLIIDRK